MLTGFQRLPALWSSWRSGVNRVKAEDRYLLVRQLYVLHRAGVPLLSSLSALEAQVPAGVLKRTLRVMSQDLLGGSTLSQAFAHHPRSFDPLFIGLIKTGEAGGLLEEVLKRVADLTEWELELNAKIKQALQYPAIVLATLLAALSIMVVFVLPRFAQFFGSLAIPLPIQTRLVLAFTWLITHYGWLLGLGLVGGIVAWYSALQTDRGRLWWHTRLLRLPIFGPLFLQLGMSRFARTVSVLNASGLPMLETLALAGQTINNSYIQSGLTKVAERVRSGQTLAKALSVDGLFPPIVIQMVGTGEETGRIDELLQHVADYYDQQATFLIRKLMTYLEPALLILVGCGVLLMATAVLIPMWDLVKVFQTT